MKSFGIIAVLALTGAANAQYSYTGSTITENFDGLLSAASPFSATVGLQATIPGLVWVGAKIAGSGTAVMPYTTDNVGSGNSGGIYNYGLAAGGDRALGSLGSGSNTPAFGVAIVNNSGSAITEFSLSFNSEQYRSSTSSQNFLTFAWGTSATATDSDFLTSAGMAANVLGDVIGDNPVAANGGLVPNISIRSYALTITGLNVGVGDRIYIRWSDFNDIGNDAGLAIDDLSFSAVPTPGTTALLCLAGLAGLRRRRA